MGKLSAIIAGIISITLLAYFEIAGLFNPLINLLGPFLGYKFPLLIGILGLVAGNPFTNLIILISWVIIGVIIGVFAGKGLRAAGASILIFSLTASFMALIFLSMFNMDFLTVNITIIEKKFVDIAEVLPYIIPAISIVSIKNEPVISTLYSIITALISSGSTSGLSITTFKPLIMNVVENFVILIIVSSIVGSLIKRRKRVDTKKVIAAISIIIVLILIFSVIIPQGNNSNNVNTISNQNFALKNLSLSEPIQGSLNIITHNGSLINSLAFASNYSGNKNIAFAAVVLNSNLSSISSGFLNNNLAFSRFSGLIKLMPDSLMIVLSKNSYTPGSDGTGNLLKISGMTNPETLYNSTYKGFNLYVYGQNVNFSKSANAMVNSYNTNLSLFSVMKGNVNNGYFIPGTNSKSVTSSVMAYGYGNYSLIFKNNVTGDKEFLLGIFEKKDIYHSSGSYHNLSLSGIINYNKTIVFNKGTLSFMGLIYPNMVNNKLESRDIFYTNNQNLAKNFVYSSNATYNYTSNINPDTAYINVNYTFPAYIYLNISYKTYSNRTIIYTTMENKDNSTLRNVSISENTFINNYNKTGALSLISGSPSVNGVTLKPGQYKNFSYTVKLNGPGEFVPYANISYSMNNKSFNAISNTYIIKNPEENWLKVLNSVFIPLFDSLGVSFLATSLIDALNVNVFDVILLLIVILDVFIEIRSRRKT